MTPSKQKRKRNENMSSSIPAWLHPLIGPLHVDFIAPLTLESALESLKSQQTSGYFRLSKVRVDLIPDDDDTFSFVLKKWGSQYSRTEAHGRLQRWNSNDTHVIAQINTPLFSLLVYGVFTLICVLVGVFAFLPRFPTFSLIFIGIMLFNWIYTRDQRFEVHRVIQRALLTNLEDEEL